MLQKTVEIGISITPGELAEEFWGMNCDDQAKFFNHLGDLSSGLLAMQLHSVTVCGVLCANGSYAMSTIGEYAESRRLPELELPGLWEYSDFEE